MDDDKQAIDNTAERMAGGDLKVSSRVQKDVDVRVLGSVGKRAKKFKADGLKGLRLHARVIIRDGREVFLGSQSLRTAELDGRREVGLVVKNPTVVKSIVAIFEKDWAETKVAKVEAKEEAKEAKQEARAAAGEPAAVPA